MCAALYTPVEFKKNMFIPTRWNGDFKRVQRTLNCVLHLT